MQKIQCLWIEISSDKEYLWNSWFFLKHGEIIGNEWCISQCDAIHYAKMSKRNGYQ